VADSLRELDRALRQALSRPAGDGTPGKGLELSGLVLDPPRLADSMLVEGELRAIPVDAEPQVGFSAFLDGIQQSTVVDYVGAIPIVGGRTAAVIRSRVERRLTTWGDGARIRARLYAPRQRLPDDVLRDIERAGLDVRDTLGPNEEGSDHPIELLRRAVDAVKMDREQLEQALAEQWVERERANLFVDGGLPKGQLASVSPFCVGVIKTHHVLYAPAARLDIVLGLSESERTPVMAIDRNWGPRVLSWYLRLREPPSHDPFLGLVRVEIAAIEAHASSGTLSQRADEVSSWILAERAPLSMPDARWDRMVYGIYDCEQFLRSSS
jgi:hypothetical protein